MQKCIVTLYADAGIIFSLLKMHSLGSILVDCYTALSSLYCSYDVFYVIDSESSSSKVAPEKLQSKR